MLSFIEIDRPQLAELVEGKMVEWVCQSPGTACHPADPWHGDDYPEWACGWYLMLKLM